MAKKATPLYLCQTCGQVHKKWVGKCDECGEWNTLTEEKNTFSAPSNSSLGAEQGQKIALNYLDDRVVSHAKRACSGMQDVDRVLGGGLTLSSAVLLGGDPGIGKSTLLLQIAARFAESGLRVVYISGEEAKTQITNRAERLHISHKRVQIGCDTNLRNILTTLKHANPDLVIIDSIQTLWADHIDSTPGSVTQVRAICQELVRFAKTQETTVILVGHVTKEGHLAGPRTVEHMVDTVMYFEGERGHQFRVLRSVKNRFGPTNEIAVFEMTGMGLQEILNPSALFLSERSKPTPGSVVFAGIEGTRSVLAEIQALVAPSSFAAPKRTVVGLDSGRLSMIIAVLEARCNISFVGLDVYLNVAGGRRIQEPAADLAVAAALLSAQIDKPFPINGVAFGEISLSGNLRAANQTDHRLKETERMGFTQAFIPAQATVASEQSTAYQDLTLIKIETLRDLVTIIHPSAKKQSKPKTECTVLQP